MVGRVQLVALLCVFAATSTFAQSEASETATKKAAAAAQKTEAKGGAGSSPAAEQKKDKQKPADDADQQTEPKAIEDISIEELLEQEVVAAGDTGSFGSRLEDLGVKPYVHAYAVMDFLEKQGVPSTFDAHYFNVFIGANIAERVIPEVQLEYEHGGDEIDIRFAQIDIRVVEDLLAVRAGKFLVPMGIYNEYLYPEYISKTPQRPFAMREIVPVSWAETGVQLRGRYGWAAHRDINYALYAVNGLEQKDGKDGGGIRGMRGNNRDKNNSNKAFGGKFGVQPLPGVRFGLSGYRGGYTRDGRQNLSIYDANVGLHRGKLTLESEYAWAKQERANKRSLDKNGWYALAAYKVTPNIEPLLQYDTITLDGKATDNKDRWTVGLNYYPFPKLVPSIVLKTSYEMVKNQGVEADDNALWIQLAVGF